VYWAKILGVDRLNEGNRIRILSTDYVVQNAILRQIKIYSDNQAQTKNAFAFKWGKRKSYDSKVVLDAHKAWLIQRYLKGDENLLNDYLFDGAKFLDAGCGSGFSTLLLFEKYINKINYLGVDISEAIDIAASVFEKKGLKGEFLQADLMNLPFEGPTFDIIFSEGVLHHTNSTEKSFKYLASLLLSGGRFMFYVYKKKAPVREFCDDHIREYIKNMNNEEAWQALMPLTMLGKTLGELKVEINVPEDVPYLGIPAGKIDLQRLFYWYIFKAYYRPEWNLEEMNHVNFDWYRPLNCHRHTPEEIKNWCEEAGLSIEHMDIEDSGITIVSRKNE
jgi:ubiquinone/menaquinone biosynthesis C-methylase UbiE